jgi:uncharacterized delta-60 repeat protein
MPSRLLVRLAAVLSFLVATSAPVFAVTPGEPDASFGAAGRATADFNGEDTATVLLLQADGKIVAGGSREINHNLDWAIARFAADGSLDPTFGAGGRVTTAFGFDQDLIVRLLQQTDGKIVGVGTAAFAGFAPQRIILARYSTNGTLDGSFGINGVVSTPCPGGGACSIFDALLMSDGGIMVGGSVNGDFLLVRYDAAGALDAGFGDGGILLTDLPDLPYGVSAFVGQGDDKIIAGGSAAPSDYDAVFVRFHPDGSLDASFGTAGTAVVPNGGEVAALALRGDGTILAAMNYGLARLLADGSLDGTFGTGGIADGAYYGACMSLQSTGAIIVAAIGGSNRLVLTRISEDGVRDATFGFDGFFLTDLFNSYLGGTHADLAVDGADRIVVAGRIPEGADSENLVVGRFAGNELLRCAATPLAGCKAPAAPGRSQIKLDSRKETRVLKWRWKRGDATTDTEIGRPDVDVDHVLCMYDESNGPPSLIFESVAPSAGVCAGAPCWRQKGPRFMYKDRDGTPRGLTSLAIKGGESGRSEISADGRGSRLPLLPIPAPLPFRVQLQSSTGACWGAVFSAPSSSSGNSHFFNGKSD